MIELFGHPFSSYTWKVLIALHENATPFVFRSLEEPDNAAALARYWAPAKFPLLVDDGRPVMESTVIIEWLQLRHPGPVRLIPADPDAALEVRMLDRVFDNHVMANMQRVVSDALRPSERRDPVETEAAKAALTVIYGWLDAWLVGRRWAVGDFSLADCAAAPALFYADWVQPIGDEHARLQDYRARLLARPAVARCVEGARPFRGYFPLGAPDRD